MKLSELFSQVNSLFKSLLSNAESKCKEQTDPLIKAIADRDEIIGLQAQRLTEAEMKLTEANLEIAEGKETIQAALEQLTTPEVNPTPVGDSIIEQADALPAENTPEVQAAIDETVGTSEPTSEAAIDSALEMILEDSGATEEG